MRRFLYLSILMVLALLSACQRQTDQTKVEQFDEQTAITEVQATVDITVAQSIQTSEAWMSEVSTQSTEHADAPIIKMTGIIRGELDFPAAELPPMRVVAINVETNEFHSVEVNGNTYSIETLPPGSYHIIAYVMEAPGFKEGQAGGYTQAVLCGLSLNCDDHELVIITIGEGEVVEGINLGDWNAPEGLLPPDPTRQDE